MRKSIIIFFLIFISTILFSEVIILETGEKIVGKIIKIDEDTITVLTQKDELVFDRDKIKSIFRTEDDYNESFKKEDQIDYNLIKNGDFTNNDYWLIWNVIEPFSEYSIVNGVAVIDIKVDYNISRIGLWQSNLHFEKNTEYTIKFQAKASTIKNIKVIINQMGGNFNVYYENEFRLTKNMKEYKFPFKMKNETDNNVRIFFEFKYEKCKIYIDNVEIKKKL